MSLNKEEYDSLPNREYFKQKFPFEEGKSSIEMDLSPNEFSVFKMSAHPGLRERYFSLYSNSCKANAAKIVEMVRLRQDLALTAN